MHRLRCFALFLFDKEIENSETLFVVQGTICGRKKHQVIDLVMVTLLRKPTGPGRSVQREIRPHNWAKLLFKSGQTEQKGQLQGYYFLWERTYLSWR